MKIKILGFKGEIRDINETLTILEDDGIIQLMDARAVAGKEHVLHATAHAIKAFKRGENIANDIGLEICLRTAATRQINKALEMVGLKEGPMEICAVLIDSDKLDILSKMFKRDDSVLEPDKEYLKKLYNLTENEIELVGVTGALMERTTLLILES
ncbi:MAG: KEOPS complex subunit Cgi121 [Methanothermobacter sp.]|nr:KEOPS complex subunit Cgi121 [Methanothermobacter sp.]